MHLLLMLFPNTKFLPPPPRKQPVNIGEHPAVPTQPADNPTNRMSLLARDGVPHATIDGAISQLLLTWDVAASIAPPARF